MASQADIGIIGGSGLYSLLDDAEVFDEETEFGRPSGPITIGRMGGRKVAFLPRHGPKHKITPANVPYRANITALKSLGVKRIIATNAVGSLKAEYRPSEMAFFDQYVNMTFGRKDTFYDQSKVVHVSMAEPYCPDMRKLAAESADRLKIKNHRSGSVVVINGPRFSTKAESRFFSMQGFDMINMTQYPEVALAREQEICYLGVGLITDYDAGLEGRADVKPVTSDEVGRIFAGNLDKVKSLITDLVPRLPEKRACVCSEALKGAVQN